MKKIAVLLFLSASLYAAEYKSNAIGQHLMPLDGLTLSGYEAVVDGENETLYLDGETVFERSAGKNEITTRWGERSEYLEYEAGVPVLKKVSDSDRTEEVYYEYDQSLLRRKRIVIDGKLEKIITYFFSDGVLSGYTETGYEGDSVFLFAPDTVGYAYDESESAECVRFFPGGVMRHQSYPAPDIENTVSKVEEGMLEIRDDMADGSARISLYAEDGRLMKESRENVGVPSSDTVYSYEEDGALSLIRYEEGDNLTIRNYQNGKICSIERYRSNELLSIRYFDETEGEYEIKYKNGRPYARLSYDEDGKTLLSLDML